MTGVSERTVKVSRMNTPCRETATRGSQVHLRRLGSKGKGPRGLGRLAMQDRRIDLLLGKRGRVLDQVLSILLRHPAFRTNGELCFKVAAVTASNATRSRQHVHEPVPESCLWRMLSLSFAL